ncbi:hypothetical protein C5C03_06485 [Clavibacter michiganensis]|nr:hypothetical protein C5C03_06485 [Clavibacter michiganensis]PPF96267.1 hypothetical protein C5C05_07365 [Clavibacter michiganensis]
MLSRLLGPTFDVMGGQMEQWYLRKNVERVAKRAAKKADTDADGSIPPRVAAEVFEKAQWADDDFLAEYLSGVLATARTPDGDDDRGVSWTALVGRMSADQLRLHYVLYRAIRSLRVKQEWDSVSTALEDPVVVTYFDLTVVMGIPWTNEGMARLLEALYGLRAEDLVGDDLTHGSAEYVQRTRFGGYTFPPEGGGYILARGTTRGAGLFLQAHGLGKLWARAMFDPDVELDVEWPDGGAVPAVNILSLSSYHTSTDSATP